MKRKSESMKTSIYLRVGRKEEADNTSEAIKKNSYNIEWQPPMITAYEKFGTIKQNFKILYFTNTFASNELHFRPK